MIRSAFERSSPERQYVLTMNLGLESGGQTKALLRRSNALAVHTNTTVTILTFGLNAERQQIREGLTDRGDLATGVQVWNIWEYLASSDTYGIGSTDPDSCRIPVDLSDTQSMVRFDSPEQVQMLRQYDRSEHILADHYFRPDGTRLLSDFRKSVSPRRARRVTLFDSEESPVQEWRDLYEMFFWVMRNYIRERHATMVVDSKAFAREIVRRRFRMDNVAIIHQVHSDHILPGETRCSGKLKRERVDALEHSNRFDGVVVLTDRQRHDIGRTLGYEKNISAVPNVIETDRTVSTNRDRARTSGVVVSRLAPGKRIEDSVRAVAEINSRYGSGVRLTICGRGSQRSKIENAIRESRGAENFKMKGYVQDVENEYRGATFSLLTSRGEGFALAIVESMSSGCIPIAYNVPYGPSDIITDEENGFLVPFGDVDALVRTIHQVQTLPENAIERMREAARRRAGDFAPYEVARQWREVIRSTWEQKRKNRPDSISASIDSACFLDRKSGDTALAVELTTHRSRMILASYRLRASLVLRSRTTTFRHVLEGESHIRLLRRPGNLQLEVPLSLGEATFEPGEKIDCFVRIEDGVADCEVSIPIAMQASDAPALPNGMMAYRNTRGDLGFRAAEPVPPVEDHTLADPPHLNGAELIDPQAPVYEQKKTGRVA